MNFMVALTLEIKKYYNDVSENESVSRNIEIYFLSCKTNYKDESDSN